VKIENPVSSRQVQGMTATESACAIVMSGITGLVNDDAPSDY